MSALSSQISQQDYLQWESAYISVNIQSSHMRCKVGVSVRRFPIRLIPVRQTPLRDRVKGRRYEPSIKVMVDPAKRREMCAGRGVERNGRFGSRGGCGGAANGAGKMWVTSL